MIISSFNRYFEKHGRKTYIVLGIIISVIFVFSLGGGMDGCGYREPGLKSFGKMYGRSLKRKEMMAEMRKTDIGYMLRTGMSLSRQGGDSALLLMTLQRMRAMHKAQELGLDKVSDAELVDAIQSQMIFGGKENFTKDRYLDFVNNFLVPQRMSGGDLDEIIKENLIIDRLEAKAVEGIEVAEDEVNEYLEKYNISQFDIIMDQAKDAVPADEEIQKFFETRKNEITLEDQKAAVVASISIQDLLAKADGKDASEDLKKSVEPSSDEIAKQFENGKDRLYKDKKLEDVKEQIRSQLRRRKASEVVRKTMDELAEKIAAKPKGETAEATIARFQQLSAAAGAKIVETGFFSTGDEIPGMTGRQSALARTIRGLTQVGAVSRTVATIASYSVVVLKDQKPSEMPAAMNDEIKEKIIDKLTGEKALVFFNEKIASYKDKVAGQGSVWDLMQPFYQELEAKKLSEDEMMAEYSTYQDFLSEYIMPFFKEEVRSAKVVAFKPSNFEGRVQITEEDMKAEYETRKAEIEKKQVQLNQIVVKFDATADEAAKAAKKAKLVEVLDKLKEGKQFTDLVAEYSEDEATKGKQGDTGMIDAATLDEEISKAVLALEVGQISGIMEGKTSMVVAKLMAKDMGRTIADQSVKDELTVALKASKSKHLAADAAYEFSTKYTEAMNQNDKAGQDKKSGMEVFEELVSAGVADAELLDLTDVTRNAAIPNYGRESELMKLIFERKLDAPCTYMVAGENASYVACLKAVKPSYMSIPSAENKDAFDRLKRLYKKEIAMAAAKKLADEKAAAINKELAGGAALDKAAGEDKFKSVEEALDFQSIQANREVLAKDKMALMKALHKGKVGTVLEPVKTFSGYVLTYLDKREVKSDDDSKALAEQVKASMLQRKKAKRLQEYYKELEDASGTKLVEGLVREK